MTQKTAVNIKKLNISIAGNHILKNINLSLPQGQVIGLLGPSGAGKTTLIRTIVGLLRITTGKVNILGLRAGNPQLRHMIGYMAQDPDVYADLSVYENINYFAQLVSEDPDYIDQLIDDVELAPQLEQLTSTLSGGQMPRLSLLIALIGKPEIIILDEPTVGLDPVLREKLWGNFHDLANAGSTVIVTSHVMDEARRCDQLVLIRNGEIVAADSPTHMMEKTNTKDMEAAFLTLVGAD